MDERKEKGEIEEEQEEKKKVREDMERETLRDVNVDVIYKCVSLSYMLELDV